ncbi:NADH-quinone oxidoreductase subunit NuoN [Lichenifustis flavocetrariae]|uniref:NADH-quinone oxidoreductase subunit N n=1 Tax=Lichenifustis flavocetrariae TaxID=2949735 RepID=A0AA41YYT3_9HYPH|nr:NADH-quinone oxidoreductase subunit NuoN [Lichenifustis flavocetrariae]MCW6509712.1 NADH-quinone oxidoreductase subunit NuoN [Lichenifustis flavocetrariae]
MVIAGFSLAPVLPEFILAVGALLLLLFGAVAGERLTKVVYEIAIVILGVVLLTVIFDKRGESISFDGAFVDDPFSHFMKVLALIGSIATLIMSIPFLRQQGINKFEFPILVMLSTLGMMTLISAGNLIALYLGFELMSLALYVIAAFHRDDGRASEAGLKYFVLGALSSGLLLYGASLIYGFTGSVNFAVIGTALQGNAGIGVVFGLVFLSAGLAFKMSAVPFHMWTPDVYEGAPTPVTAFFATAPKMAAVAITVRVVITAFPGIVAQWQQIIIFISIASMLLGSFAAIGQTNFKRLMAYSAIGNMGFALVGLAAGTEAGVFGVLIYMLIYLVMTLGTFAAILAMKRKGLNVETISDLAGLSRHNGPMAFFLAMIMFSLAGIPPLAGFWSKFYVFQAAIQANLFALSVIGVLSSVVAAFYYLRIVKLMYFDEPVEAFDPMSPAVNVVLSLAGVFVLLFTIWPGPFKDAATVAAHSLF